MHLIRHGTERLLAKKDRHPAVDIAVSYKLVVGRRLRHTIHEVRVFEGTRTFISQLCLYCTDGCIDCITGWLRKIFAFVKGDVHVNSTVQGARNNFECFVRT